MALHIFLEFVKLLLSDDEFRSFSHVETLLIRIPDLELELRRIRPAALPARPAEADTALQQQCGDPVRLF